MTTTKDLNALLTRLESFGQANDTVHKDRPKRMLNITRDTGEFLAVLVLTKDAQNVLEIGTSNGYSTLWLADACTRTGGHVTTVELSDYKVQLAKENFEAAGLTEAITQIQNDARNVLAETPDASIDLLFLDSERSEYLGWWSDIKRVLKKHGLLVIDNATSHKEEMTPFMAEISNDPGFSISLVPVGNGEFLAVKR
jgi:predicted O-methyltransferase YrrM